MFTRPSPEEVRRRLSYDPLTGALTWKIQVARNVKVGDVTGRLKGDGYVLVHMMGVDYKAHVLAVVIMTGAWPLFDVDHWDLNRSNNVWLNLRQLTRAENQQNHNGPHSNSTTKVRGVSFCGSRSKPWCSNVSDRGQRHFKWFDTKDEAEAHTLMTRKSLHEFCPENKPPVSAAAQ